MDPAFIQFLLIHQFMAPDPQTGELKWTDLGVAWKDMIDYLKEGGKLQ